MPDDPRATPANRQLSDQVADETWPSAVDALQRPQPRLPLLVQFAGVPLSGKSTIARALALALPTAGLHVENDALRARVAAHLGRPPQHDAFEHFVTYQTAWNLLGRALQARVHALHDATNLRESGRQPAYEIADAHGATVIVVFVLTAPEVLEERAAALTEDRQRAYRKFIDRAPDPAQCNRPRIVLDGALPADESVRLLADEPVLRALWETPVANR